MFVVLAGALATHSKYYVCYLFLLCCDPPPFEGVGEGRDKAVQ
jgi:hypothetical protein